MRRLHTAQQTQRNLKLAAAVVGSEDDETEAEDDSNKKRTRASNKQPSAQDHHLSFYPATIRIILKRAQFFFFHLLTHFLFPDKDKVFPICRGLILNGFHDAEKEGQAVDWSIFRRHSEGMVQYVHGAQSNFRNTAKAHARHVVDIHYSKALAVDQNDEVCSNQAGFFNQLEENATELISGNKFLRAVIKVCFSHLSRRFTHLCPSLQGIDTDFTHPAIFELLKRWLWGQTATKSKPFYSNFPEGTYDQVLIPYVAASATFVSVF